MKRRVARALAAVVALALSPALYVVGLSLALPLPDALAPGARYPASSRVVDREGRLMREVRAADGSRARFVPGAELDVRTRDAMLAAEDKRFRAHPGVDVLAIARAAVQVVTERRIVSGASTLTQQLARAVVPRPRTVLGKLGEMALALRIERSLGKDEILEQWANRVAFGAGLRGIEAASRRYFDRGARDLSLSQAAALASIPRGPSLYDPRRGTELVRRRRDRVLARMAEAGMISEAERARAASEPIDVLPAPVARDAAHFVAAAVGGELAPSRAESDEVVEVRTTLDLSLQRELEQAVRNQVDALAPRNVSAAALVVLDNASGDVLAWVGSPRADDEPRLGGNDGVLARRQPGSALKPFVYGLAFERLGFGPATLVPDVELHLGERGVDYSPHDYDARFHGPVRLREALASSYNVPAVWTAATLGVASVTRRLFDLGLLENADDAGRLGAAVALGDGEVRLLDLAAAYASIARRGLRVAPRAVLSTRVRDASGARVVDVPIGATRRVMSEPAAGLLADVLSDREARLAAFGDDGPLELPFAVAVKTGTSKGFRDNVTVGFTRAVTVAVWVGNFDGSPMQGVSGVTGAGPIFAAAMRAAMRGRLEEGGGSLRAEGDAYERVEVCALSGRLPGEHCAHRRAEVFARGAAPRAGCDVHVEVAIDRRNGLLAGPACAPALVERRVVESWPPLYRAWAREARRPSAPDEASPLCPRAASSASSPRAARLAFPVDGATFVGDPASASPTTVVLRALAPAGATSVRFVVDGVAGELRRAPFEQTWRATPGEHRVVVEPDVGGSSEPATIRVL